MPKNPHATALGSLGGKSKAARMTAQERKDAMTKAVSAYWGRLTPEQRTAEAKRRAVVRKQNAERKTQNG